MQKSGINMERVKKENRSLILKCINNNGAMSRKDIAAVTGLTPASVTQITTKLIEDDILVELGSVHESAGTAGRKKVLLDMNESFCYICSVNIESQNTTLAVCDFKGHLKALSRLDTDKNDYRRFFSTIAKELKSLIADLPEDSQKRIQCVSVGIPGIIDKENGISVHAYGIWNEQIPVKEILESALDIPVIVENNVNAFAHAEILFGMGRIYDSLLIIKWGPGVGSTIVIDGQVYEGRHGKTAELGHFIAIKDGKKCSCGRRGCLETILSYDALNETIQFLPEEFENAYMMADSIVKEAIDSAIDIFARCIVNTCTIVAPNRIILAGSLFGGEVIRDSLIVACEKYDKAYNSKRIYHTSLSQKESYIGPVAVYIHNYLNQ